MAEALLTLEKSTADDSDEFSCGVKWKILSILFVLKQTNELVERIRNQRTIAFRKTLKTD
jgi:hypothetical protein